MRLLLDTMRRCGPSVTLSACATLRVQRRGTPDEVRVSVASVWEVGIKRALGKLTAPDDLALIWRQPTSSPCPSRWSMRARPGHCHCIIATRSTGC